MPAQPQNSFMPDPCCSCRSPVPLQPSRQARPWCCVGSLPQTALACVLRWTVMLLCSCRTASGRASQVGWACRQGVSAVVHFTGMCAQ